MFSFIVDGEEETVIDPEAEHEDETYENPDAELERSLEMKVTEGAPQEQSLSSSPTRLQEAIEEEEPLEIQPVAKDEEDECQLPDLENEMKSEIEEEQDTDAGTDMSAAIGENEEEISEPPVIPKSVGRGGGRGRGSSNRARRSRGRKANL